MFRLRSFPTWILLTAALLLAWQPGVLGQVAVSRRQTTTLQTNSIDRNRLYDEVAAEFDFLQRQGNLLKKVVRLVRPTVVHLESLKSETGDGRYGSQPTVEEAGSGVIIRLDQDHYILTNRHVIAQTSLDNIKVRLHDGRFLRPLRVWTDIDTDVAVIRVRGDQLVAARLGNSDETEMGDFVLAVGSPFGLSHSVSYGIVSAKGRRDLELGNDNVRLQDFIQTDAAINPGNSGGPLLNLKGEVIGINTAIASNSGGNEGVSFAIPIRLVMFVAKQLIARGEVSHAYLGVQLDRDFDMAKANQLGLNRLHGALVKGITPRSPAFFANLQVDDLITSYDGVPVEDDDHLVNLVSLTPINQTVDLSVMRKSRPVALRIKLGNRRHFEPSNQ